MITRRNRQIGVEVSLSLEPNEDPSCRWQTDCEHGNCVGHATRRLALEWLSVPWEWCEECRRLLAAKQARDAAERSKPVAPIVVET
jgi:hypothetical protein